MVEAGTAPPAVVAATQMNKNIARDLLSRSLPVPDEVLRIHVDRLIHVGTRARPSSPDLTLIVMLPVLQFRCGHAMVLQSGFSDGHSTDKTRVRHLAHQCCQRARCGAFRPCSDEPTNVRPRQRRRCDALAGKN